LAAILVSRMAGSIPGRLLGGYATIMASARCAAAS
jgi:hypothetical protein